MPYPNHPAFEYRTTFTVVPADFPNHERISADLSKISPKPPKGEDWQLASSTCSNNGQGTTIFYFWERTGREMSHSPADVG